VSDYAIVEDEDPREFHSPFELTLDSAGTQAFIWLVAGHVVFVVGLFVLLSLGVENAAIWATPLYAAPLIWKTHSHRLAPKLIVLLIGLTAAHWLGTKVATDMGTGNGVFLPGFVGGAIGAGVSLGLCGVTGLLRPGGANLVFAAFGTLLLAGVGGLGVYLYLTTGDTGGSVFNQVMQLLKIYTPWQVVFAYVLAKLLRPDG
jgi:hypothetical protein